MNFGWLHTYGTRTAPRIVENIIRKSILKLFLGTRPDKHETVAGPHLGKIRWIEGRPSQRLIEAGAD